MGRGVVRPRNLSPKPEAGAGNPGLPVVGQGGALESAPRVQVGDTEAQGGAGAERGDLERRCQPHSTEGKLSLVEELCCPPAPLRHGTHLGVEGLWLARLGLVVRGHGVPCKNDLEDMGKRQ